MNEFAAEANIHYEKDKRLVPYLLSCHPLVTFSRVKNENGVIYFGFVPSSKAIGLISQFFTNNTPSISPKKLFEAIDEFRTILYREKDKQSV